MKRRVVVLGVGNPLYGDDGFGIAAVAAFGERYSFGPEVEVVDAGTEGLSLLGYVEDTTELVILDVVEGQGLTPGDRVEYDAAFLASGVPLKLSEHQVGVEEVLGLAAWRGRLPQRSVLIGVVASTLEFGLDCPSPLPPPCRRSSRGPPRSCASGECRPSRPPTC